ncbi:unnamed protein product [Caenorhabditis sp. 36 PRJEB53466]|nr:unnamed protein product [Caenorhabditis sp. 36 PRJEB53466]
MTSFQSDSPISAEMESTEPQIDQEIVSEEEEAKKMWQFLIDAIPMSPTGSIMKPNAFPKNCWNFYSQISTRSEEELRIIYEQKMRNNLHLTDLDTHTKVKLYYVYLIPIDVEFLEDLRRHAVVEIDRVGQIVRYIENDGTLFLFPIETDDPSAQESPSNSMEPLVPKDYLNEDSALGYNEHKEEEQQDQKPDVKNLLQLNRMRTREFSQAEDDAMLRYILKSIEKDKVVKPGGNRIWGKFVEERQTTRSVCALQSRYQRYVQHNVHLSGVDLKTKLKLFHYLKIPVNKEFLKELRQRWTVETENGCITKYSSKTTKVKKEPESPEEGSSSNKVVDPAFKQLTRDNFDPSESGQCTPLKRVRMGVDDEAAKIAKRLQTDSTTDRASDTSSNTASPSVEPEPSEDSGFMSPRTRKVKKNPKKLIPTPKRRAQTSAESGQMPAGEYLLQMKQVIASFNLPNMEPMLEKIEAHAKKCEKKSMSSESFSTMIDATLLMFTGV